MTVVQTRILEMFRSLSVSEREALLPHLEDAVDPDNLSPDDVAAIEEGIAQADRGEVVDADEALARIAARYNFPRA